MYWNYKEVLKFIDDENAYAAMIGCYYPFVESIINMPKIGVMKVGDYAMRINGKLYICNSQMFIELCTKKKEKDDL